MAKNDVNKILKKYERKLAEEQGEDFLDISEGEVLNREYELFRSEILEKKVTNYERWCEIAQGIITIQPSAKDREKLEENIEFAHLNVTPQGAASFGAFIGILVAFLGVLIGVVSFVFGELALFLPMVLILAGLLMIKPLSLLPNYLANRWRLEASNQMVLCVLYVVMYMRHTSNLEHAVRFAAEHVGPPLSLDLKKVFWDIETEKFFSIKESLDFYLERWRPYNLEFVEAFHLIEGSLFESSEKRRIDVLEKALEVMLEGSYNKMLHYAHNLKGPITLLYMLGVILPILGLVIFPLIGSFLGGVVQWYHLAILYNIFLPLGLILLGNNILIKRPTGYGESELLKSNPQFRVYEEWMVGEKKVPFSLGLAASGMAIIISLLGFIPLLVLLVAPGFDFPFLGGTFFDFKGTEGPYGTGALILGMLIPLGIAMAVSFYYSVRTRRLIKLKKEIDDLEEEFSGAIFQLGNRIGDGIPSENAFGEVSVTMEGTPTGKFFATVDRNIRKMGYGLGKAIFDSRVGAILLYPSNLIQSSMKVLIQSAQKGPKVVSTSLLTISKYVDRIKQVNERLKDLLADVLSSMISQINFLTPLIAGIVVGVGSMVTTIINKLGGAFESVEQSGTTGNLGAIANIINIGDVVPGYYFQLIVGIYVVQITIILTILSTTIERGIDKTTARYRISKNLIRSVGLYLITALIGVVIFTLLANAVSFAPETAVNTV